MGLLPEPFSGQGSIYLIKCSLISIDRSDVFGNIQDLCCDPGNGIDYYYDWYSTKSIGAYEIRLP